MKEVKGLNPTFDAADIRGKCKGYWLYHLLQVHKVHTCYTAEAAYRFFKTKSEEDSLKRNGMAERKKVTRRRQERVTRVSFAFMF